MVSKLSPSRRGKDKEPLAKHSARPLHDSSTSDVTANLKNSAGRKWYRHLTNGKAMTDTVDGLPWMENIRARRRGDPWRSRVFNCFFSRLPSCWPLGTFHRSQER